MIKIFKILYISHLKSKDYGTTLVHPYLSRAFQQYEMHGCGFGDLNVRNKTNKQPSLKDRLMWHMLLAIIEFKI
jgi:hypothetical protein